MASQIGQTLREARTQQGIELSEVERVTKIRVKFLQAMEEDRWEELPAPVYARNFLATYAHHLGLDEEPLIEEYRRTIGVAEEPEAIPAGVVQPGSRGRRRSVNRTGVALLGSVIAVLMVLVIVAVVSSGDGEEDRGEREAAATGEREAGSEQRRPETATAPIATDAQPAAPGSEVSLELRATAEVWICLVDADGARLVNGETLVADQARGPFASPEFAMTFGNGSVEMSVDGQPVRVPPLAEPLGYRVTADGARRLSPGSQPTCV